MQYEQPKGMDFEKLQKLLSGGQSGLSQGSFRQAFESQSLSQLSLSSGQIADNEMLSQGGGSGLADFGGQGFAGGGLTYVQESRTDKDGRTTEWTNSRKWAGGSMAYGKKAAWSMQAEQDSRSVDGELVKSWSRQEYRAGDEDAPLPWRVELVQEESKGPGKEAMQRQTMRMRAGDQSGEPQWGKQRPGGGGCGQQSQIGQTHPCQNGGACECGGSCGGTYAGAGTGGELIGLPLLYFAFKRRPALEKALAPLGLRRSDLTKTSLEGLIYGNTNKRVTEILRNSELPKVALNFEAQEPCKFLGDYPKLDPTKFKEYCGLSDEEFQKQMLGPAQDFLNDVLCAYKASGGSASLPEIILIGVVATVAVQLFMKKLKVWCLEQGISVPWKGDATFGGGGGGGGNGGGGGFGGGVNGTDEIELDKLKALIKCPVGYSVEVVPILNWEGAFTGKVKLECVPEPPGGCAGQKSGKCPDGQSCVKCPKKGSFACVSDTAPCAIPPGLTCPQGCNPKDVCYVNYNGQGDPYMVCKNPNAIP